MNLTSTPFIIGVIALCSILGAVGQLSFKTGIDALNWQKLALGLFLYGLATILYVFCLRFVPLSIGYPIIALSYIWVMILSSVFLHESITVSKVLGSFVIVGGIILIVRG